MDPSRGELYAGLLTRGVSRRRFLQFSTAMAAALALPAAYAPRIAKALEQAPRTPLIWLRGQSCGGDSQAFMQAADPTTEQLLLEMLSVDYAEGLMTASGDLAAKMRADSIKSNQGKYIAVIEGSIPAGGTTFAAIGGRPFEEVAREVCAGAAMVIGVGSCAYDGGVSAAMGGRSGAKGVGDVLGRDRLVSLPGCPVNVNNLAATVVHWIAKGELPERDFSGRPLFAYGGLIHNQCERRAHFEYGEFVTSWGDEAAQKGWCLYKLGCKGPETYANCPTSRYAQGVSWNVRAGTGCIGCTMPKFWDVMGPAYSRLPATLPFAPDVGADAIGLGLVGLVAGAAAVHAAGSVVRARVAGRDRPEPAFTAVTPMLPDPIVPGGESAATPAGTAAGPGAATPAGAAAGPGAAAPAGTAAGPESPEPRP